jgi:uncharacterized protein
MSYHANFDKLDFVGDLKKGRPTLGNLMRVSVYRLLVYSMKAVMAEDLGKQKTNELFYSAGMLAGQIIFRGILKDERKDFNLFEEIKDLLFKCGIGIFEVKQYDEQTKTFLFVVKEDVDCSGMPIDGETKCAFDEGLISGILTDYFKLEFETKEVGCWATGEKSCIFRSAPLS